MTHVVYFRMFLAEHCCKDPSRVTIFFRNDAFVLCLCSKSQTEIQSKSFFHLGHVVPKDRSDLSTQTSRMVLADGGS